MAAALGRRVDGGNLIEIALEVGRLNTRDTAPHDFIVKRRHATSMLELGRLVLLAEKRQYLVDLRGGQFCFKFRVAKGG